MPQEISARSGRDIVGTLTGIIGGLGSTGAILQGPLAAAVSAQYGWDGVFWMLVLLVTCAGVLLVPMACAEVAGKRREAAAKTKGD
jgi:sugar phosphate permease